MAIGTTAAMIGASAIGAVSQASAAKKAAKAQTDAANQDIAFQKETRDLIFDRLDPYYQGGTLAQQALMAEMGLGNRPMVGGTPLSIETIPGTTTPGTTTRRRFRGGGERAEEARQEEDNLRRLREQLGLPANGSTTSPTQYRVGGNTFSTLEEAQAYANANPTGGQEFGGFEASPGYQFRVDQGNASVNALAGARGGLDSGATRQALMEFGQGIGSQEYGNWYNRLAGLAGTGFNAATAQGQAAQNTASGVSNALAGIGNANAAGAVGVGNAISSGINNGIGIWGYQQGLAQPAGMTTSMAPTPNYSSYIGMPRGGR